MPNSKGMRWTTKIFYALAPIAYLIGATCGYARGAVLYPMRLIRRIVRSWRRDHVDVIATTALIILFAGIVVCVSSLLCTGAKADSRTMRAKVIKCIESDKCTFEVELGFGVSTQVATKLCNIGPLREYRDQRPEAEVARWWAEKELKKAPRIDLIFWTKSGCEGNGCEIDRFDRPLVLVVVRNQLWNDTLVEEGHAIYSIDKCGK